MSEYPTTLQHGSGRTLTIEPDLAVVSVAPGAADSRESIDEVVRSAGLTPVAPAPDRSDEERPLSRVNDSDRLRWVRLSGQREITSAGADIETELGERAEWLGAVYRFPGVDGEQGLVCPLPHVLLVRVAETASADQLASSLSELGLVEDGNRSRYLQPFRYLRVENPKSANAYELADRVRERSDVFLEVRWETMPMIIPSTATVNDPLLATQWGVHQVEAPAAWDIERGDASVVICILDEGCDLTHPDLAFSDPGINLGTMLPDGSPTGDHGTACAGIAAAVVDNGEGVAGVAGGCSILPAAFQNWTDVECAAGIRYAADNGASILSMSFGVYGPDEDQGPTGWDFALIDPAIAYAHAEGVVLCAATGNEDIDTFNRYPSRHPLVIACGASDQNDNRKSPTSPDGEDFWGSNYAPGVSVVAPGVLIPTTDRQGSDGYNPTSGDGGDYFATFNGTSSATPHVAGLAGLLRSANPALSNTAVRDILEQTAAKVGTVPYDFQPEFPNGTRNNEMGYGRISAIDAIQAAHAVPAASATAGHDLTGDGRADVVGFGNAGVWVALNNGNGTFAAPVKVVDNFGYAAGSWRVERHPRFLADLTGDGRADVVGFGNAGVWVALNNGNGTFAAPVKVVDNFGYAAGSWRVERHPRFLADLTGDGRADVVGFGNAGVWVALNNGNGTFAAPVKVVDNFGYAAGSWRVERHPRFLADLTGDGRADVVGFGNAGVWVALNNGNGTFAAPVKVVDNFGYAAGSWRVERHPRFLADLTGDGRADVVGFGNAGVWVALNNGNGTFAAPVKVVDNFGYAAGSWRVERHPRFLADLTGDGRADVVGFGNAGVWVALNNGNGTFAAPVKVVDNFGYAAGSWRVERHPRFLADLTGDGSADLAGFGNAGVWVSLNTGGAAFKPLALAVGNFGYTAGGWRVQRHPRLVAGRGSVGG